MNCAEFAERIEDYLVGAISVADREEVNQHATVCPACGTILREVEEGAAFLRLAVPQVDPPPGLRSRILAAAHTGRPPLVAARSQPGWRWTFPPLAAALSLLGLLLLIGLGAWTLNLNGEVGRLAAENSRLAQQLDQQRAQSKVAQQVDQQRSTVAYILSAPYKVEKSFVAAADAPGAHAQLHYIPTSREGVLVASALPRQAADRSYQVWGRGKEGPVSLGLLRLDEKGNGLILLEAPVPFNQFEAVGVSLEPAGGSPLPTGPRMMQVMLN